MWLSRLGIYHKEVTCKTLDIIVVNGKLIFEVFLKKWRIVEDFNEQIQILGVSL